MPKGIFIGIGGTGVTTVARLKALLFQRAYDSDKAAMDADCTFIFYDTDFRSRDKAMVDVELQRMMGSYPVIDMGTEYIDAGPTAPYNMFMNARNSSASDVNSKRMMEWAIDPNVQGHFQMPQKQLCEGAGAQRMAGRTGVFFRKDLFEQRILTGLKSMQQLVNQGANMNVEHPAIWVFSSSNGGTSSSALMDVLYMADRLYKANVDNADPYLRLVLYMPKAFIDANHENALNYARNAYAALWELNEFRYDSLNRSDGQKFGSFAIQPDKTDWRGLQPWNVCSYVMAVDTESQKGNVSIDQMYINTAELCYFLHTGAAGQTMVSNLDNDLAPNGPYARFPRTSSDDPFPWMKFVVGSGYKAITKSDDFLRDYVRHRLRYDLFGYGLLGYETDKIMPSSEERMEAAKAFAQDYILCHLANIDKLDSSPNNSLYLKYKAEFEKITVPNEDEVPSRDEWTSMGTTFITNCRELKDALQQKFDDPTKTGSKAWYLREIEKTVMAGVDKTIVEQGLRFTYSLLNIVDDDYCEKTVLNKLQPKSLLPDIEVEITDIIENNKPKKGIADLVQKLQEYRDECLRVLAKEHIRAIITDITQEKVGLLEYLRKGNQSHKGIAGVMETATAVLGSSKKAYQELVSTFSKTANEVCSAYFPQVHKFTENCGTWVRGNEFEKLYSSILPLNLEEGADVFESIDYGCPPLRKVDEKGLSPILSEIKNRVPNHNLLFAEMAMSNPQTTFSALFTEFSKQMTLFIERALVGNNEVKTWLDKSLDTVFDEHFTTEGVLDTTARLNYITHFTASIPVFYPCATGATPQVTQRWLYVGASQKFANTLGFQNGNSAHQYVPDNHIGNRFLVCKIEVGHNFYDYKYFNSIRSYYESERRVIENEGSGCHIHKAFIHRDIVTAYDNLKAQKFNDFVTLCWYDSFFEFLNEQPDKTSIKTFFGEAMSGMPGMPTPGGMPGMPAPGGMPGMAVPGGMPGMAAPGGMPGMAAPGGMPGMAAPGGMPGMAAPGGMPGMAAPGGMPGMAAPGGMPGMAAPGGMPQEAPSQGMQMPGMQQGMQMPGMQQGMQMPGMQPGMQMPGMQQGMQMPGMQQGMQMPGMQMPGGMPGGMPFGMGMNMNIVNGYQPIISINAFGQIKINFRKMVDAGNHLGFERDQQRVLALTATNLTEVWRNIINFDDIIYSEDYFTLIDKIYQQQSQNSKQSIAQLFYAASYMNNGGGEVWNRFSKKIEMLTGLFQQIQSDCNVWYQMMGTIQGLIYKNIFY